MITVQVDPTRAFLKVERIDASTRKLLRGTIIAMTKALATQVRVNLSGAVLNQRSGRLYSSIKSELVENPTTIYGVVGSYGVPYARIHEYGGVIKHPGSSKFQAWQGSGGWVYTHFTRPHDIPMPERSYLRSALAGMQEEIVARMTQAVHSGARAA